jgi:hypothetical protein
MTIAGRGGGWRKFLVVSFEYLVEEGRIPPGPSKVRGDGADEKKFDWPVENKGRAHHKECGGGWESTQGIAEKRGLRARVCPLVQRRRGVEWECAESEIKR